MGIIKSFKYAGRGIWHIVREESNARIHLLMAALALIACAVLGVTDTELAAIFFAIIIVFLAEIGNTVLEKTLDLIDSNHNPGIRRLKDMAAGSVLIASIAAVIVGVTIFWPYILGLLWRR